MKKLEVVCEIEVTLSVIGGKYKPLILLFLAEHSPQRFGKLAAQVGKISQKTLTNQLRELELDALITRKIYAEVPLRVEYSITDKGKTLLPILELMCEWGHNNLDDRYELINPQCL